jgi:hypothetical protein
MGRGLGLQYTRLLDHRERAVRVWIYDIPFAAPASRVQLQIANMTALMSHVRGASVIVTAVMLECNRGESAN